MCHSLQAVTTPKFLVAKNLQRTYTHNLNISTHMALKTLLGAPTS